MRRTPFHCIYEDLITKFLVPWFEIEREGHTLPLEREELSKMFAFMISPKKVYGCRELQFERVEVKKALSKICF